MNKTTINRVILIVMDSVGVGNAPDAKKYNDEGTNTVGNIVKEIPNLQLPNLCSLGLSEIVRNLQYNGKIIGTYGLANEVSSGKDTTSGHWEIAGLTVKQPFPTYPNGFPDTIIKEFEEKIGTKVIGNKPASGTAIIDELGDEHVKTGFPIVYTSGDSVFQLAAHEEIIPLNKLYEFCSIAREILKDSHAVGRVIARPFLGNSGNYARTANRKDFSLKPFRPTMLDYIKQSGKHVKAVGKVSEIYAEQGITESVKTASNKDGIEKTIQFIKNPFEGLLFINLVDFDTLFGHRRDVQGYANALREFDAAIPDIIESMQDTDVLIITADHGNDPTASGTDHTREQVPILIYGKSVQKGINIGVRSSFADMGASITEMLGVNQPLSGESFLEEIIQTPIYHG